MFPLTPGEEGTWGAVDSFTWTIAEEEFLGLPEEEVILNNVPLVCCCWAPVFDLIATVRRGSGPEWVSDRPGSPIPNSFLDSRTHSEIPARQLVSQDLNKIVLL